MRHRKEFGKRAPQREADDLLERADRWVARFTVIAGAAAQNERGGHPVTGFEVHAAGTDFLDDARKFMAHHMG